MREPAELAGWFVLLASWGVWWYPLLFRAPHRQKRPSITRTAPTFAGLFLECAAIFVAFVFRGTAPVSWWHVSGAAICGVIGSLLSWKAVLHLGRQFRINAGLYEDHELVTSGPYAIVRHPIYASLLALLIGTICVLTPGPWALVSLALFIVGTEIRVATEDRLLASRFGDRFDRYKASVKAYLPYLR
jgi:protein-S-isoprenylcysteine O-methyltransferase Ste14